MGGGRTAALQLYDVTIRDNAITGNFRNNCITGVLPNHVARIYIGANTCHKTGPTPPRGLCRGDRAEPQSYVNAVRSGYHAEDNTILSDVYNAYNKLAGIFVTEYFDNLCLLGNTIIDTATAIYLRGDMPQVQATANTLDSGRFRLGLNCM